MVVTQLTDSVQFRVRQHDDYLDIQLFGLDDNRDDVSDRHGLMTQLAKFDATLIETQSLRQHKTSTLWINGNKSGGKPGETGESKDFHGSPFRVTIMAKLCLWRPHELP